MRGEKWKTKGSSALSLVLQELIRRAKQKIAEILCEVAQDYQQGEREDLPEDFYKAISYLGYELTEDYYGKLLEEMKEW